jgi:hypothetical protein
LEVEECGLMGGSAIASWVLSGHDHEGYGVGGRETRIETVTYHCEPSIYRMTTTYEGDSRLDRPRRGYNASAPVSFRVGSLIALSPSGTGRVLLCSQLSGWLACCLMGGGRINEKSELVLL